MTNFPTLNHRRPSCYLENSYIPKSQFEGRDIKVLLDRIAEDDHSHSISLLKVISVTLIVAVIINRSGCLSGNGKKYTTDPVLSVVNPSIAAAILRPTPEPVSIQTFETTIIPDVVTIPTPITITTPDPITVLPEPEIVIPCSYNVTAYDTFFEGDCTVAEMRVAFADRDKLREQEYAQNKAEGRRMAEEFRKESQIILDKWDERIEKSKKALEETIRRYAQTEYTPEEIAERWKTKREIACQMHQDIGHLPGFSQIYTPVCVKNEIELLGGKMSDNCDIIKQLYRKQSLLYHPDKNHAPDAQEKFMAINKAYEKICP